MELRGLVHKLKPPEPLRRTDHPNPARFNANTVRCIGTGHVQPELFCAAERHVLYGYSRIFDPVVVEFLAGGCDAGCARPQMLTTWINTCPLCWPWWPDPDRLIHTICPRCFEPWSCELRDRIGGRPERF